MNIFDDAGPILCLLLAVICFAAGVGVGSAGQSDGIAKDCEKAGLFVKNSKAYDCQPRVRP